MLTPVLCPPQPKTNYKATALVLTVFMSIMTSVQSAQAYIIAYMGGKTEITERDYDYGVNLDNMKRSYPSAIFEQEVSIMSVGAGNEAGNLFLVQAAGFAAKMRDRYPDRLIMLYANNENEDRVKNELKLQEVGFKIIKNTRENMKLQNVFSDHLWRFTKIASLEFFTHSNIINGMLYEDDYSRYDGIDSTRMSDADFDKAVKLHNFSFLRVNPEQKELGIQRKFLPNAFAGVYGCNTGWKIAPTMARAWRIPVVGSYTGTEFQYPYSNGLFHYDGQNPEGTKAMGRNKLSFEKKSLACSGNVCARLKPTNTQYSGIWAHGFDKEDSFRTFDAGLPHYKFNCSTSENITEWNKAASVNRNNRSYDTSMDHCKRGITEWVMRMPSIKPLNKNSSFEDYKEVVKELLCPMWGKTKGPKGYADCQLAMDQALLKSAYDRNALTYTPYNGNSVSCNGWKNCNYTAQCDSMTMPLIGVIPTGKCLVKRTDYGVPSTVFMEDYKLFLESYFVTTNQVITPTTVYAKVAQTVVADMEFKIPKQITKPVTADMSRAPGSPMSSNIVSSQEDRVANSYESSGLKRTATQP